MEEELEFGKEVTVEPVTKDRYGRTVANVRLPDGTTLNHELLAQRMCWWFRKYAPNNQVLKELAETARTKG